MRHDEPDEADGAREGHDTGGQQRGAGEDRELETLGADPELDRRLLAEGQEIERARVAHHEPEPDRRQQREERQGARWNGREVAEEPVDDAAEPVEVHERDHHRDRRREEDADDDARQQERLDRQARPGCRDEIDGRRGEDRAGERKSSQPHGLGERQPQAEALADHDAERGAGGDAEHGGLGQRIPGQRLEPDAGDGERASGERGDGNPRQPDGQRHDALDRLRRRAARHRRQDRARRNRRAADEERPRGRYEQRRRQDDQHQEQAPARAHRNASG